MKEMHAIRHDDDYHGSDKAAFEACLYVPSFVSQLQQILAGMLLQNSCWLGLDLVSYPLLTSAPQVL